MTKTFVIGDSHGDAVTLKKFLLQEKLLDSRMKRLQPDVRVVHLGDLANCVISSRDDDLKCLTLVGPVIDKLLLGNHEAPYFGFPAFSGFFNFPEVGEKLKSLNDEGLIAPAMAAGDIFLSHAGLATKYQDNLQTPQEAVQRVTDAFLYHPSDPLLQAIGYARGGREVAGGILWSDWSESHCSRFMQIFGHSVGNCIRAYEKGELGDEHRYEFCDLSELDFNVHDKWSYCIDVGGGKHSGRLAGAWIVDGIVIFTTYEGNPSG